jgi:hypothetical protein
MFEIELNLATKKKLVLPFVVLSLAMFFIAYIDFWYGAGQKRLTGNELAAYLSGKAFQSALLALFYIFWMLQMQIQHTLTGFYKMLLVFGWSREKLFLYQLFQDGLYAAAFMALNFLCYAVWGLFYSVYPWNLIFQADINAMLSQFLYLLLVGAFAMLIGSVRTSYVMVLPVFIYWLLEGWFGNYLNRQLDSSMADFFPLKAMSLLVSDNLLGFVQLGAIDCYSLAILLLLYRSNQKKMFV